MLIDKKMDHGPLLSQTQVALNEWPIHASELIEILASEGAVSLAHVLPLWVAQSTDSTEQTHGEATYCEKITKEDGLIDLKNGDPYQNYLKILAYDIWPRAYFFTKENKRVVITDANFKNNKLQITKVIPEGKKEADFDIFLSTQK
jgi:methionyl-tRNA formyltransferase